MAAAGDVANRRGVLALAVTIGLRSGSETSGDRGLSEAVIGEAPGPVLAGARALLLAQELAILARVERIAITSEPDRSAAGRRTGGVGADAVVELLFDR